MHLPRMLVVTEDGRSPVVNALRRAAAAPGGAAEALRWLLSTPAASYRRVAPSRCSRTDSRSSCARRNWSLRAHRCRRYSCSTPPPAPRLVIR